MRVVNTVPDGAALENIRANLHAVRERIATACRRAGRHPPEVRLLPVSKTVDERRIRLAHAAGCRAFGENKVQEACAKAGAMADLGIRWSVIGHLQTNKAKYVARFAVEFQALDSLKVAEALDRRLQKEGRGLDVLIQVDSSGEASKYGLAPEEVCEFLRQLPAFAALKVRGLMTLEEYPLPARNRDDGAADDWAEAETNAEDDPPPAEGDGAFPSFPELMGEDSDLTDQHRAAAQALKKSGGDQYRGAVGQAADQRGDAECGDGDQEDTLAPITVSQRSGRHQHGRHGNGCRSRWFSSNLRA